MGEIIIHYKDGDTAELNFNIVKAIVINDGKSVWTVYQKETKE